MPITQTVAPAPQPLATIDLSRGDQFLVRFPSTHGQTVYLYDKNRQIYVPFTSAQGFQAFTGKTPEQAYAQGDVYDLANPLPGTFVPDRYGFDDTGHVSDFNYYQNLSNPTTGDLSNAYGKNKRTLNQKQAADMLGTLFTTLKRGGAISQQTFDQYISNPANLAKYISAWAYGGYTADDIYRDIKGKELGLNTNIVDTTKTADQMAQNPAYASVKSNQSLNPPQNLNVAPSFFNNPIFSIPSDAFKTLVPVVDPNSASFKDEASKIQDSYYDLLLQQVEAKTSQEKAIADDNYRLWKENINKQYGIQLADNAAAAWNQVRALGANSSAQGLLDSGIYNEGLDRMLRGQRQADQRIRDTKLTAEQEQRRQYYLNSATPDQIKNDLTDAERQAWGLTPSADLMTWLNQLKTQYPDLTDQQIQQIKDTFVDQYGNARSQLYQQLYSNKYGLNQQKTASQQQSLLNQKLLDTEKAYEPYTQSDNPFIQYKGNDPALSDLTSGTMNAGGDPFSNASGLVTGAAQNTPSSSNVSSKYANVNGTIYNKTTGQAFSTPQQFYQDSGLSSMNGLTFDTSWKPNSNNDLSSIYANVGGTIWNKQTNTPYSSPQDFFNASGKSSFNNLTFDTTYKPPSQTPNLTPPSPQTPSSQPTYTPPPSTPAMRDLSSQYGLYNGTVYNLNTGFGYSNPQDFFKDAGVDSFNNIKLNNSYKPTFYKYADSPTVYNAYNNRALSSADEFYRSGGAKDFSGIDIRKR